MYPIQTCNCHLDQCLSMIYDQFDHDSCPTCAQYTQPDTTTEFNYAVLFEGDPPTERTKITTTSVETTTTNIMEDGTTTIDSDIVITTTDSDTTVNTEDTTTKSISTTVDPDTETTTVVETTTTVVVETSTKTLLCNTTMSYGVFLAKNVSTFLILKVFSHLLKLYRTNLERAKNVAVQTRFSPVTNIWSLFKLGI